MTRRVGPYTSIAGLQEAATLVKQLQPGAAIGYFMQVSQNDAAKSGKPARAKKFPCPTCGVEFATPQALGPHSRAHKRAAEKKQAENGKQSKPLPSNTEAVAT